MEVPLDEKWFNRIKNINPHITQHLKVGNFTDARAQFESTDTTEPLFTFPKIENIHHDAKLEDLAKLSKEIQECEMTHPLVKQMYQDKILERTNQFKLLAAVRLQLSGLDMQDEIKYLNEAVYGKPDKDIFFHLLNTLKLEISQIKDLELNQDSLDRISFLFNAPQLTSVPPFQQIYSEPHPEKALVSAKFIRKRILSELSVRGLDEWRVQISVSEVGSFCVWPNSKRIIVPSDKMLESRIGDRVLTETVLRAVIAHEVGTHAIRTENGLKSKLKLLGLGLSGYEMGEEGLATYREQLITGANDYFNRNVHLAICLAYGLDKEEEPRNFREVYNIMIDYFRVFFSWSEPRAKARAFTLCQRIFCGASGRGTAFIWTKDIAYREGNIAIHSLIKSIGSDISDFNCGKYNPTNPAHVRPLLELGILTDEAWILALKTITQEE